MIALNIILIWLGLGAIGTLGLSRKKLTLRENIEALGSFMAMGPYGLYLGVKCLMYNRRHGK